MDRTQTHKQFLEAIYRRAEHSGWPVDRRLVGQEVFGGMPKVMEPSTDVVVNECRDRGWLTETPEGNLRLTEEGLRFIGKA